MEKNEESYSPGWGASFFMQTTEDVTRAFMAAAAAASAAPSSRPSVLYSSKDDSGGHLQKLQNQVFKVLKGLSHPTEEKRSYNPEVLTTQKRQWASFQLQSLVFSLFTNLSFFLLLLQMLLTLLSFSIMNVYNFKKISASQDIERTIKAV